MDEVGSFAVGDPLKMADIDFEDLDFLLNDYMDYDFEASDVHSAKTTNNESMKEIEHVLTVELVEVPAVTTNVTVTKAKRFMTATEEDLQILQ